MQVSRQAVIDWENGEYEPQPVARIGVATVFNRLLAKKALGGELSANLTTEVENILKEPPCVITPVASDGGELPAEKLKLNSGESGTNGKKTKRLKPIRQAKKSTSSAPAVFEFGEPKKRI